MTLTPDKEWWTAQEIADARLPDLPDTRQGLDALAKRLNWRGQPRFARRRDGRGGGWEYSWRLFPSSAQRKLLVHAKAPVAPAPRPERDEAWEWFDTLPQSAKNKAQQRLRILQEVEALDPVLGRVLAADHIARAHGVGERTIRGWFVQVEGIRLDDRLPYLAPRHRAAPPSSST
jgi:hypothetical protein